MKTYFLGFIALLIISLVSCKKDKLSDKTGELSFSLNKEQLLKSLSIEEDKISQIVISIETIDGRIVKEMEKIVLYKFNEDYISKPIAIRPGEYNLTSFFVINDEDSILYLAPKEGSALAYLLSDPLPVYFEITKDRTTKVNVEVISTSLGKPEDFGYATFSFNIIKTVNLCVAAFIYNTDSSNLELTAADIKIIPENLSPIYTGSLKAETNSLVFSKHDSYAIIVNKAGYKEFKDDISADLLKKYDCTNGGEPLIIVLEKDTANSTIVLQPGPEEGIDALVWNLDPDVNRGMYTENSAVAWTNSGSYTVTRGLLKFDLSNIPSGIEIKEAKLFLFGFYSTGNGYSESLSGPNNTLLCRATSLWDENTVTWNNQPSFDTSDAIRLDSCNGITDFVIDVKLHVQKMIEDTTLNHGWVFKMEVEEYYRRVVITSSDYENSILRPKLEIIY